MVFFYIIIFMGKINISVPTAITIMIIVMISAFYGLYHFLTKPVVQPHEIDCVVINKYINHTTTVSKHFDGHPSSAPFVVYQNLETDEIIQCEVHPYVYDWLTTGDTCILWYSMGNYTYKFRK